MNKVLFSSLLLSSPVYAEVSDKIASQPNLWASGFIVGVVLALGIRWSRWLNIIGWPLSSLFFYFAYHTLAQPDIGPAIIKEQGTLYVAALYGSATFVLLGVLIGNYLCSVKNKSNA